MQYTTNYNLKKPGYTDPADIEDINANMDVIDAELQARESDSNTHVTNTSNPHGVNKSQVALGNVDNVKQAPYTHLSATGAHAAENISLNSANFSANQVKGALDELFTSVSNGKNLIATSITDKGVPTSGSDSFNTMANNINSIETVSATVTLTPTIDTLNIIDSDSSKGHFLNLDTLAEIDSWVDYSHKMYTLGGTANAMYAYGRHDDLTNSSTSNRIYKMHSDYGGFNEDHWALYNGTDDLGGTRTRFFRVADNRIVEISLVTASTINDVTLANNISGVGGTNDRLFIAMDSPGLMREINQNTFAVINSGTTEGNTIRVGGVRDRIYGANLYENIIKEYALDTLAAINSGYDSSSVTGIGGTKPFLKLSINSQIKEVIDPNTIEYVNDTYNPI